MERFESMERTIDISVLWNRMWTHRLPIAIFVLVATIATGIVAFMLPNWYQATASLLPPTEEDSGFGIARLLRGVAVPGIRIPTQATPADVFIAVLDSRRLREDVVRRHDLLKVYKVKFMQDAIKQLKQHVRFRLTDAGTIDMSLEDQDPKRAAAMLQTYIELLDRFNRDARTTRGRRTRIFVEQRMAETRTELATAEQALADYQAMHKTAIITSELSTAAENAARIYAQRTALEVRLGVVRGYSREGSAEAEQIEAQLVEIDRQLRQLPETGLELARLLREVKKHEQVFILLTAQYEEARIDEARDVVTVDVLDPPIPPERKSKPPRGLLIIVGFLLSLGTGVTYALFQEERQPEPRLASVG
jgi:uncharacterized protein involved in exopolysaccharide biosynthesis